MPFGEPLTRWLDAEQGHFALWLPVAAIAGDAAYFAWRVEPPYWVGAAALALGAAAASLRRSVILYASGLLVAFFAAGFATAQFAAWRAPPWAALPSHAVVVSGRVIEREALPDGARLTLDHVALAGHPIGPRVMRLSVTAAGGAPGSWVTLRAMVSPPASPAYPGGRDLQRDAWFVNLAGSGYGLGRLTVDRPAPPGLLAAVRDRIAARVERELPGAPGTIAATLLTGFSADIPPPDRAAFRDAGLSHLLAIAGLHIGIVMGLALVTVRFLLLRSEYVALFWPVRQLAAAAALLAGLIYLTLTGLHVPTLRSFAMATLVVLALLAGRRPLSLRGWGIAALMVLAIAPEQVTGPSFQLSFAAVLALIAGYEALREPLRRLRGEGGWGRRFAHHAATLALTSLLAGVACLPFIAFHFGRIQLYFVLANLIAVPITAFWIMPAGLIALALMPLGLDRLALVPMGGGIGLVLRLAHTIAAWPGATIAVPHLPLAAMITMAAGLAWLCLWRSAGRLVGLTAMLAGMLVAALAQPPDLLIAANARLVGLVDKHALYLHAVRGGDAYVQSIWEQYLGRRGQDIAGAPSAACDADGCRIALRRGIVRIGTARSSCDAGILVTQSGGLPYCRSALEIDREKIWRDGAIAIRLGTQARVETDRRDRGTRPWVYLPPEMQIRGIGLPFAKAE